ncbi:GmrSD restriction endonuclease domain-containing protein [Rothia dentocariosa]|uniref:GmrSD restriction endonuclease domain-containing protein n=1 Tax=Rothia dentocariosa TaxID=2047 RepID=UPI0039A3D9A6
MLKTLPSRSDAHVFWSSASDQGHSLKLGTRFSAAFLALGLALSGCSSETITISESTVSASSTSANSAAEHSSASSQSAEASQQPTVSAQDSEQTPTVTEVGESPEENNTDTSTAHPGSQIRPGTVTIVNPDTSSVEPQGTAPIGSDEASEALRTLNTLPVKGRAPKTGYSRAQFGDAWSDIDHNGCDTRNDILNRDLTAKQHKNSRGCVVISGILNDPYTGKIINFMRGKDTSEQVQIDHVVALSDAWQSGAQEISAQERLQLANDPENLLAVDGPANQQKSDSDAATWLPANASFRCSYVARQIRVKAKYHLWVKPAEKEAMINVLTPCAGAAEAPAPKPVPDAPAPVPQADSPQEQNPAPALTFQTCDDARAAGYRNMHRGAPGYSEHLDRDGDGIACESR